jgi:16S rRNA (cytosine967-C5)-methyltransferase
VVSESIYGVLRHKRLLERIQGNTPLTTGEPGSPVMAMRGLVSAVVERIWQEPDDQSACLDSVRAMGGVNGESLSQELMARLLVDAGSGVPPAERHSLPDWLWASLVDCWGEPEADILARLLNQPAPVDVRVNRRLARPEVVSDELERAGYELTPLSEPLCGFRLNSRGPLSTLDGFKKGWFEVQDSGSQWIARLLNPIPGQTIVDLCAGAGGKSLHLADLMDNRGRVISVDVDGRRLQALKKRLRRARAGIIKTLLLRHERDPKLRSLTGKSDGVLVDAPCSGTGRLRRNPEVKWQLTPDDVENFHHRQVALLHAGAALVRPGGRLAYATCSMLCRENQEVVNAFMQEQPDFRLIPIADALGQPEWNGTHLTGSFLTFNPSHPGTDGFFGAVFVRK